MDNLYRQVPTRARPTPHGLPDFTPIISQVSGSVMVPPNMVPYSAVLASRPVPIVSSVRPVIPVMEGKPRSEMLTRAAKPEILRAAGVERSTTVYVGHIPPLVPDEQVRTLLGECGKISKWNRSEDPQSQQLTPFAFCEFETAQGVWMAVKFLNNVTLGGKSIVVNCQEKTRDSMERWRQERLSVLQTLHPTMTPHNLMMTFEAEETAIGSSIAHRVSAINDAAARMEPAIPKIDIPPPVSAARKEEGKKRTSDVKMLPRERERLSRWNARLRDRSREFHRKEKEWMRNEKYTLAQRRKDYQREAAKLDPSPEEIQRLIQLDLTADSDRDRDRQSSRRHRDQPRWRIKEKAMDDNDRQAELTGDDIRHENPLELIEVWNEKEPETRDEGMEANSEQRKDFSGDEGQTGEKVKTSISLGPAKRTVLPAANITAVFESTNEQDDIYRKHKPLSRLETHMDRTNRAIEQEENMKVHEERRAIAAMVPSEPEEIFAYPLDWNILYEAGIFDNKLPVWIDKKVEEYLGSPEPDMSRLVLQKIVTLRTPAELIETLTPLLDVEVAGFVTKLWKVLIFEQLRLVQSQ